MFMLRFEYRMIRDVCYYLIMRSLTWLKYILMMPKLTFSLSQQCFADITTCVTFGNLFPLHGNRLSKCRMCRLTINSTNFYGYIFCVPSVLARLSKDMFCNTIKLN